MDPVDNVEMATFQRSDDAKRSTFGHREYVIDEYDADVHRARVLSVGLKDAITRDQLSPWSWKMVRLYGIVLLTTLSMSHDISVFTFKIVCTNRCLDKTVV